MQLLMIVLTVLSPLSPQPSWESRLRNPEARHPALVRMLALDTHKTDLTDPQSVSQTLLKVVFSTEAAQADRLLAIRTLGHLRLKMAANALAPLTVLHRSPMDKAMAQEAVSALVKMKALLPLSTALDATDPGIRTTAARAGAGEQRLCKLLNDPWKMVRAAAAIGLKFHPNHGHCLATALADKAPEVLLAAAESAILVKRAELRKPLRKLASKPSAYLPARQAAIIALAVIDDLEPARQILATHLKRGGLLELARASVRALDAGKAPNQEIRGALSSGAFQVQLAAAQVLSQRQDRSSLPLIRAALKKIPPRQRPQLQRFLDRFKAEPVLGQDVVRDIVDD